MVVAEAWANKRFLAQRTSARQVRKLLRRRGAATERTALGAMDTRASLHRAVLAVAGFIIDRRVVALSVVGRSAVAIPAVTVSVTPMDPCKHKSS